MRPHPSGGVNALYTQGAEAAHKGSPGILHDALLPGGFAMGRADLEGWPGWLRLGSEETGAWNYVLTSRDWWPSRLGPEGIF